MSLRKRLKAPAPEKTNEEELAFAAFCFGPNLPGC
jgi:hypothetical protein